MRKESLYIARLINNHANIKYCSLCLGINGTWCGNILLNNKDKALCTDNALKGVSKYAN